MKKLIALLVFATFIAGLLFVSYDTAFAKRKDKDKEKKEEKVEEAKPEEPKLIYTFKDNDEMAEFEKLYIAKQATFGRMGVLQAYFAMEQNNLAEIDRQMEEKFGFKMDPTKMYDLNRDTREIKEVGVAPGAQPPAPEATAPPAPATE